MVWQRQDSITCRRSGPLRQLTQSSIRFGGFLLDLFWKLRLFDFAHVPTTPCISIAQATKRRSDLFSFVASLLASLNLCSKIRSSHDHEECREAATNHAPFPKRSIREADYGVHKVLACRAFRPITAPLMIGPFYPPVLSFVGFIDHEAMNQATQGARPTDVETHGFGGKAAMTTQSFDCIMMMPTTHKNNSQSYTQQQQWEQPSCLFVEQHDKKRKLNRTQTATIVACTTEASRFALPLVISTGKE